MKKIILLIIVLIFLTAGCGLSNIDCFVLPDDIEFLILIEELDTPQKISEYMQNNFDYEIHYIYTPDPYTLWQTKKGDCDDFSKFITFIANYHGYETYQIIIFYKNYIFPHVIAVFKENDRYNFSDNRNYLFIEAINFREIVEYDNKFLHEDKIWSWYIIYDYWNNVVEQGTK